MPQIGVFITPKDYVIYASLPEEAQKRIRDAAQKTILEELNIIPKKG